MTTLRPFFEDVQRHYDLSDEFFRLFLDESMTYSCAYFEPAGISLEEAQAAKIDLSLGKLGLKAGQRLLDIGCGWGAAIRRAAERWGVRAIGLTLSRNQHAHVSRMAAERPDLRIEARLCGWEEFDEPVDRIVSIGAFEHFRAERFGAFFGRCRSILPADGRMLLHTIVWPERADLEARGIEVTHESVLFAKFIQKSIFPGGQLVTPSVVRSHAEAAGFSVERVQSLQPHYAKTLAIWAERLEAKRGEAIAAASAEVYETYMRYLTGCSRYFGSGHIDVCQFTLTAG